MQLGPKLAVAAGAVAVAAVVALAAARRARTSPAGAPSASGAATSLGASGSPPPSAESPSLEAPVAPPEPRPDAPARAPVDVTFLVTADTHLGETHPVPLALDGARGASIERVNEIAIDAMNAVEGTAWPAAVGGVVGRPRGVLVAGDLTETGRPHEWERFEALYGSTGAEGRLRLPVFEGVGNHDRGGFVQQQVVRRHGGSRYSWNWDAVHVVCLGEAPDDADLAWLRDDLAAAGPERGVVLFFHFPLSGAYSDDNWFGEGHFRDALAAVLSSHAVLGIFTGHYHASGAYRWRGHDAYLVGSPKHSWHSFAVVHVTGERTTVAAWSYDLRAWWWWHDKPAFGAAGPERRWFSKQGALVGAPRAGPRGARERGSRGVPPLPISARGTPACASRRTP